MIKTLCRVAGVCDAVVASQYPAFTQQYIQRLGGQVDALAQVVLDFDWSAFEAGLGREEALQQMTGMPYLDARQTDIRATFARHIALQEHLNVLRTATPLERLVMPHRIADDETFAATWGDFSPALPVTGAGTYEAGFGGFVGYVAFLALLSPFRTFYRRKPKQAQTDRAQLALRVPEPEFATPSRPRLMGETR